MENSRRRGAVVAVTSLLALGLASISYAAGGSSGPVPGACNIVPAKVVAADLGMSMVVRGPGDTNQLLSVMGAKVLVNGKPLKVDWTDCSYAHNPSNLGEMNFVLSFLFESSAAKASSILRAICKAMEPVSSDYSAPAIGSGACVQGSTGGMQSSNGYAAAGKVVMQLFGATDPAQTIKILKSAAPRVAAAHINPGAGTGSAAAGVPHFVIGVATYDAASGSVALTLSCTPMKCVGVAELRAGATTLATGSILIPKGKTVTVSLALTPAGTTSFANAAVTPVSTTLQITISGRKVLTKTIVVS